MTNVSEISCQNCVAACCKGDPFITMQLSADEAEFMRECGNALQTIVEPADYDQPDARYPIGGRVYLDRGTIQYIYNKERPTEPLPAGFGRFALIGACKYLRTDEVGHEYCSVYDQRPEVCRNFPVGSEKCQSFRRKYGIDVEPVVFRKKPSSA